MSNNSLLAGVKLHGAGATARSPQPDSVFWTSRSDQLCVQNFRPTEDVHYQPHTYSEYTVVVCLEGEILKTKAGESVTIGRGGVLIGNPGVEHASGYLARHGKNCESVSLSLDAKWLAEFSEEFQLPLFDPDNCAGFDGRVESQTIMECARTIAEEMRGKRPGHKIVIETLATRLLVETLRSWPRTKIEKIKADKCPRLPRKDFIRAYEFMRWCRKDNFRMQQLCQFLGSSEERFTRLFLASTRHTPANFYNRMLLERAAGLLQNEKLSVKEVGYELGYKTSSHFIAAFRREFAASPQEYRLRPQLK